MWRFCWRCCAAAAVACRTKETGPPQKPIAKLARQISRLVAQLNDDRAAERDAAEKKLLELAGTNTAQSDRFLDALPKDNDQMPLAVRERLSRIRQQVEDRVAKAATKQRRSRFRPRKCRWPKCSRRSKSKPATS